MPRNGIATKVNWQQVEGLKWLCATQELEVKFVFYVTWCHNYLTLCDDFRAQNHNRNSAVPHAEELSVKPLFTQISPQKTTTTMTFLYSACIYARLTNVAMKTTEQEKQI